MAHNGVLWNDRASLHLPKTKIETDSYIAVQLIEQQKKLTFDSIRNMAETVVGSFSFSILDDENSLWLVKGDSPLSILHFKDKQIYIYARTDEILYKAIIDSPLFMYLKKGHYEEISIDEGDILKITSEGKRESEQFSFFEQYRPGWWEFGYYSETSSSKDIHQEYLNALKTMTLYQGIDPEHIDYLLESGYTLDEIEEVIYEV